MTHAWNQTIEIDEQKSKSTDCIATPQESMKFTYSQAHRGNLLQIMPSWTKGGIGRSLEITNDAQRRYTELTRLYDPKGHGFVCPIDGGKPYNKMTHEEKMIDRRVRQIISLNLGHSRVNIVRVYIG